MSIHCQWSDKDAAWGKGKLKDKISPTLLHSRFIICCCHNAHIQYKKLLLLSSHCHQMWQFCLQNQGKKFNISASWFHFVVALWYHCFCFFCNSKVFHVWCAWKRFNHNFWFKFLFQFWNSGFLLLDVFEEDPIRTFWSKFLFQFLNSRLLRLSAAILKQKLKFTVKRQVSFESPGMSVVSMNPLVISFLSIGFLTHDDNPPLWLNF